MSNGLVNTRDQRFVLFEQLNIDRLFKSKKYADYSRETVEMMLNEAEKLAVEVILPTYKLSDTEDQAVFKDGKAYAPRCFHDPYKKFCEAGWLSAVLPSDAGGQSLPIIVNNACFEMFGAANYAFTMYPGLAWRKYAAMIGTPPGTEQQIHKYAARMFTGKWAGTMCLTEPGAGSEHRFSADNRQKTSGWKIQHFRNQVFHLLRRS